MPLLTPVGTDALVNTNLTDGQISPRVVALAGGRYMVIWVGAVIQPVVQTAGTIAPAFTNADIRAQIYNADGTPSGGEIIINTTTAGGQLRPVVAQLSDGNVLISWQDGVGPSGGPAETTTNTLRAQEFTSAGVATGSEFAIGNSNGRQHSLAAAPGGGFVVTYQEGGVGGAFAVGNIVARVYNSSNALTSSFTVDSTQPFQNTTFTVVEADGDVFVYFMDRDPISNVIAQRAVRFDANGTELSSGFFQPGFSVTGVANLTTGGHAFIASYSLSNGPPITIYAYMFSADGSLNQYVEIAQVPVIVGPTTITSLANGGFLASWAIDSDLGTGVNAEIMAQAFNAIGNPIGSAFQVNTITALSQSSQAFVQLTDGDIVAAWIDSSQLNGDSSGTGVNMRRIDYNPVNQNPTVSDFTFIRSGVVPGETVVVDPSDLDSTGFGYDADGDSLVIASVGNVTNGTATLNPDGTLTLVAAIGATERLSFDYTVADGNGGFATARATMTLPSDYITLRPGETALLDFLTNDYYTPTAGATSFVLTPPAPSMGGTAEGTATLVPTGSGPRIFYNPLGFSFPYTNSFNSNYFNLLLGQTTQVRFFYSNNETAPIDVTVTLEGWAQLGGTGADNLIGGTRPDHLSGGTGAANVLTGGGGNDWYTVQAMGDMVIELANEGTDTVRSNLASYTLPAYVENLHLYGFLNSARQAIGNAENNVITTGTSEATALYGLGGDDTLAGSSPNDILDGGDGNDRLILRVGGAGSTIDGGADRDTLVIINSVISLAGLNGIEALELQSSALTLTGSQFATGLARTTAVGGIGSITVNMDAGVRFLGTPFIIAGGSNVTMTINGANSVNIIKAANVVNTINGGELVDQIRGGTMADTIFGNGGNDKIMGFGGADVISGGAGSDQFRYFLASDSGIGVANRDRITDFTIGSDRLNFLLLDADVATAGDQAFGFIGTAAFTNTGIGQIRYVTSGTDLLVQADINGDGVADMEILLQGIGGSTMTAADFIL